MNPDACRDVMDRSRLPYDTGPDLNKVTAGLDELSLKKQLPLRQQTTKPVLKYNTTMAKSVHLFNHEDGGAGRRDSAGVNLYTQNGMYYTGHVNGGHQSFASDTGAAARHPNALGGVSSQHQVNGRTTPANPYVRPVSATEVAANVNGEKARRMVEAAAAISNISERTSTAFQAQTLQRNSFLRPLSGTGSTRDKPAALPSQANVNSSSFHKPSEVTGSLLKRENTVMSDNSSKRMAESRYTKKTMFDFASTTSMTAIRPHVDNQNAKDGLQHPGAIPQVPKPSLQNYASPSVRNPSYSPNKPYVNTSPDPSSPTRKEVVQASPPDLTGTSQPSILHSLPDTKYKSDNDEPAEDTAPINTQSKGPESVSLKKMPVTNTLTGTIYYRKTSLTDNLSKSGNQTIVFSNVNSSNASGKSVMPEKNAVTSTTSLKSSAQDSAAAKKVTADAPLTRPSFERSNASIQFQDATAGSNAAAGAKTQAASSLQQQHQQQAAEKTAVYTKPPTGSKDKQGHRQGTGNRTQQPAKKRNAVPQRSMSDKDLSSSDEKKVSTKKGSVSTTSAHLEQRPLGDGAPARPGKNLENAVKNGRQHQAGDYADEADNESYEDDDDDSDEDDDETGDGYSDASPSGERLPGDGEASVEDYDDDEDALDNFEDTSDGGSDGYSITSAGSSRAGRPATAKSDRRVGGKGDRTTALDRTAIRPVTASGDIQIKPAFRFSLFSKIPPTLNFVSEGEKAEQLPWELRKLLKWKMSPITPIVVRVALARVGFRVTKRNHDWLGCFGKHMKAQCFKSMREYQKLNHFPGSFQIGRKDRLWRNLSRLQLQFGKAEFSFFPQTYVLPCDLKQLKRAWDEGNTKQKWIIKPPASARGIGIRVISKWTQIPRRRPVIVQKYLHRPYLINDSKFDMRIYVYVTSYDPLRIYVYDDGLARFASCKYSSSMKSLGNKFMHLTNYSVNKKNVEYTSNTDNSVCMGHKWSLKTLWNYLKKQGINTSLIWDSIRDLIIKTIISGDSAINSMTKSNARSRYCCHELFGFDVLLDDNLKPWILEVNISPSLHSNSPLDVQIKGGLIKDMMNLAGMRLPDERDVSNNPPSGDFSAHRPLNKYCMDKRLFTNQLAPDERAKHAYFCQKHQDELAVQEILIKPRVTLGLDPMPVVEHIQIMQSILDTLTPDDVRFLCESIDEDSRKGSFQRLFPTPHTHRYLRFFQAPRYYNLLLDQWVLRYNRMEQRGIMLLQSFCDEGVHLENPSSNPRHQWAPPNASVTAFRSPDVRVLGSLNSARGSGPPAPTARGLAKKHPVPGAKVAGIVQSSSSNSLTSLVSSPQLHTPSPIGPISSPSR